MRVAAWCLSTGVLLGACAVTVAAPALIPLPAQSPEVPWPTAAWPVAPLPPDVEATTLRSLMSEAFEKKNAALGETREVVIVQHGRLVYEQYAPGYTPDTRLISWSMAKSITQALVGVAVQQGRLDPGAPMGSPHWTPGEPRSRIPWRSWLQMTDGQKYLEIGAPSIEVSDAAKMLFGPGRLDSVKYCAALPLIHEPGTHWNYNSCGIMLAADALTRIIVPHPASPQQRRAAMAQWMRKSFFDVLGMKAQPEFDATGVFYGSSSIYDSARDFAKLGLLYLRDGVWEGRRVLPAGWVDFARSPGPAGNSDGYGAGWWINPAEGTGRPGFTLIDTGPTRDAFRAEGHEGQFTLVIPSKDMVVVRLGLSADEDANWRALYAWLGKVARAFPSAAP